MAIADLTRTVTSLDRLVGEEGDTAFGDLLVDGGDGPVGIREASRWLGITQPRTRKLEERALERLAGLRELEALREAA